MPHSRAYSPKASALAWSCLWLAIAIALAVGLLGMVWGLPSSERLLLAYGVDPEAPDLSEEELNRLWEDYPNYLPGAPERAGQHPRSAFNALRSFHPDEYVILKGLANMRPERLDLFPGFFAWPALQFYAVGGALRIGELAGTVTVVRDIPFYFENPHQIARMYVIGRCVTLLMGAVAIAAFWAGTRSLYGHRAAAACALFLAVAPLFSVNSRYMTADVPMLMWIALVFLVSVRILRSERPRWYVLGGLLVGLAAATRYQGAFSGLLVFSAHLFRKAELGGRAEAERTFGRGESVFSLVFDARLWVAGILSILAFLAANSQILATPGEFLRELSQEFASAQARHFPAGFSILQFFYYGVGPGVALAALAGLVLAFARRRQADWFVFWGFAPAFAFFAMSSPFMNRYWMPVLLFPVLLAGRAFGDCLLPSGDDPHRKLRHAAALLGVAAFAASAFVSAAYADMYRRPDPRLESGRWIARHTEPGERIGILANGATESSGDADPWQFEIPPINPIRTPLVGIQMSEEALEEADPDLVVISEFQLPPLANRHPLSESEQEFLLALDDHSRYERVDFRNEPVFAGLNVALRFLPPPHDFRYADPGIRVYRRIESD